MDCLNQKSFIHDMDDKCTDFEKAVLGKPETMGPSFPTLMYYYYYPTSGKPIKGRVNCRSLSDPTGSARAEHSSVAPGLGWSRKKLYP